MKNNSVFYMEVECGRNIILLKMTQETQGTEYLKTLAIYE
jgi:hypothetical protein